VALADTSRSHDNAQLALAKTAVEDIFAVELIDARRDGESPLARESRLDVIEEVVSDGGGKSS
jgi:hypothetical protein